MKKKTANIIFLIISGLFVNITPGQSLKTVAFSFASFDVLNNNANSGEWRIELRSERENKYYSPFGGIMVNDQGALYFYAGLFYNFNITENIIVTPSFAPGLYKKGYSKDLSFIIEFRSQIELSYKFRNNSRIGLSFNHISNGSLGDSNPGVESFAFTYIVPLTKVFGFI